MRKRRRQIHRGRLQDAWRVGGFGSWEALATASGVPHPTISRIRSGRVRAPNPQTVERLAAALRVPVDWLTGKRDALPHVRKHGVLTEKYRAEPQTVTADGLRLSWLLQRADAALKRDLEEWLGEDSEDAYRSWGRGVLLAIDELASPFTWRVTAIVPEHPLSYVKDEAKGTREARRPGKERRPAWLDNAVSVTWLEQVLDPWLTGRAQLNAGALGKILWAIVSNPLRERDDRDGEMACGLDEYRMVAERHPPE